MSKPFIPIDCGNNIYCFENDEGAFVVSHNQVWVTGIYDSKETAIKAVSMDCDKLESLWEKNKVDGTYLITSEDLK